MACGTSAWGRAAVAAFVAATISGAGAQSQTGGVLFEPRVLHRIDVSMNSRDWTRLQLHYRDNDYYPADVSLDGTKVRGVAIRSRGQYSRSPIKPGFRIDIDRFEPNRRALGLQAVVLDNNLQDASMMRERIATAVLRELGEVACREAPARVYLNGAYLGLYSIVEEIDEPFLDRWFGESGGYLYEYNWQFPWGLEWLGGALEPYSVILEAKTHEAESDEQIWGRVRNMVRIFNETGDAEFAEVVGSLVPLDALAARLAADVALANVDGLNGTWGMNNVYLYQRGSGDWRFLPWDLDTSLVDPEFPAAWNADATLLSRRTLATVSGRDRYFDLLWAAADLMGRPEQIEGETSSWLAQRIEDQYLLTRDAVRADPKRPYRMEEFEQDVERLRDFARRRPGFLKCEVARAVAPASASAYCGASREVAIRPLAR